MTIAKINPTPTPILFLRKLFIFEILLFAALALLSIPLNLKIDVMFMIKPSFPFYSNNIVSGSILCGHLPIAHSVSLPLLFDHRENIPFVSIEFFFYFPFSASDSKCEWKMT